MESVHAMIGRTQTIIPVSRPNQVIEVEKNADGSLICRQRSGNQFTIPAKETEMQAFVIWTMIHAGSM